MAAHQQGSGPGKPQAPDHSESSSGPAQRPPRSLDRDAASSGPSKEPSGWKLKIDRALERVDDFQQQHRFVSIPLAVWRKFSDDDGVKLASLISYYAFLSIFPLLIVLATVLSRVLANNPEAAERSSSQLRAASCPSAAMTQAASSPSMWPDSRSSSQHSWPCGRGWRSPMPSRMPPTWCTRCPRRSDRDYCPGPSAASRC